MDIFDKCAKAVAFESELKGSGEYFFFRPLDSPQDPEVVVKGKRVIMAGSNNYLGLANHPLVKEAAIKAVERYGTGCAGSRFLNGTLEIHEALEKKLARFFRKEAALVFATGYQTNVGTISALVGRNEFAVIDKDDHASIIDGCRLSFGRAQRFRHNDMDDLKKVLETTKGTNRLIIVDGVFSMEGDIVDLPGIVGLAKTYGARIMVDDAHAIGVCGEGGRGTAEHFGLENHVDIIMGTFSKSLAAIGGFVAGRADVISWIKHTARSMMFSASLPAPLVATVSAAVNIVEEQPDLRARLWKNTDKMLKGFTKLGYDTGLSATPIIPILIKDARKTYQMCKALFENGVFVNPVISPAVPPGRELLRTSYMATHTDEQLETILAVFDRVGRQLGVI